VIEAGFPIASPDDFEAVRQIAQIVGNEVDDSGYVPVICGLSRANARDIERAWDAVKSAKLPRLHTFIATSNIHMETKLCKTPDEVVQIAVDAVKFARSLGCDDIEFSPEDAGRSDVDFLVRILEAVVDAGATTLNIPDTTGWNTPWEFGELIATLRRRLGARLEDIIFSTHCQNDLGLASANSLAGAYNGARQIECTINGIGERAGNAALEEIAMALCLRGTSEHAFAGGPRLWTGLDTTFITPCSRMVVEYTGMAIQPHKAIVGANAFRHESGIHQDGMIKNKATYEIMTPESVGLPRGQAESGAGIVLGKHSGRNAVSTRLVELGYGDIADDKLKLDAIFTRFKHVAERKKGGLDDDELEALVSDEAYQNTCALWTLVGAQVTTGSGVIPTGTVTMQGPDGVIRHAALTGSGPVDAVYKAIDALTGVKVDLESYGLESVNSGIDAMATTKVLIKPRIGTQLESAAVHSQSGATTNKRFSGSGSDTDIVVSSARAYIAAVNKLLNWNMHRYSSNLKAISGDFRASSA
jgi:2-isopropylmalate synthase